MKRLPYSWFKIICCSGMAMVLAGLITGCQEANVAVDDILGRRAPVLSAVAQVPSQNLTTAMKRVSGEGESSTALSAGMQFKRAPRYGEDLQMAAVKSQQSSSPRRQVTPPGPGVPSDLDDEPPATGHVEQPAKPGIQPFTKGKRRAPGTTLQVPGAQEKHTLFIATRDPFKVPTEVLPTSCPPSMPLCKFDRSQLKLVGVIQVSDGVYKGMVEDPDGRGYFITTGMEIGGATVTQITNKGVTLHLHKTRTDVTMPLYKEAKHMMGGFH
jgi:hypothetical protein